MSRIQRPSAHTTPVAADLQIRRIPGRRPEATPYGRGAGGVTIPINSKLAPPASIQSSGWILIEMQGRQSKSQAGTCD